MGPLAEYLTNTGKYRLATLIEYYLKQNFEMVYLTGNLRDTIKVDMTANGFSVEIPATMYNMKKFKKEGAIQKYYGKSYAERVDVTGGFSGVHKDYVELAIDRAISDWLIEMGYKAKVRRT